MYMKIIFIVASLMSGKVCDVNTNEPLVGVEVVSGNYSTYTDFDGNWVLDTYSTDIQFSYISHNDTIISLSACNQ